MFNAYIDSAYNDTGRPRTYIVWLAAGGEIQRAGPFSTQVEAWKAMLYTDDMQAVTGSREDMR